MPADIDFSSLSPADVLDLGILSEEEARSRYAEFSEMMTTVHRNTEAARFFTFMADNETRHRELLTEQRRRHYPQDQRRITSTELFDVEAPAYEVAGAFMDLRACLEASLASEEKAESFYRGAMAHAEHGEVRDLFGQLAEQEVGHQRMIRDKMAKAGEKSPVDPDDIADEPVGQD